MSHLCVHHLIEAQAARTPGAPAVVSRDGVLSYTQLNEQAGRLAGLLAARGVRPEVRVGLAVEQSARWLVALLAVWKAGGVYVPLDAALPSELAASMLADAGVELLLHSGSGPVPAGSGFAVVELADLAGADPVGAAAPAMWPDNLAYCMFTSGSTGRPKPVGISHASLAGHAAAIRSELGLRPADRFLQFTSMAVDASLEEVLPVWLAGGTVVLPDAPRPTSVELTELITARGVTVVSLPSAYWHQWTDDLRAGVVTLPETLRTVFIGGDKIRMDKLAAWTAVVGSRPVDFVADYGPTETTISCTTYRPTPADLPDIGLVPIGRPLPGVTVHLLDDDLKPVADGEPGDVWIAGFGLARGYLGAPAATADRFCPDPFGPPGTRMYRAGDRAARLPDGNLQFLGRSDRQVKIRGFRIEPGQVENAVRACAGVRDAVVVAADDPVSGARLIAYVEADAAPDAEAALRVELAGRLPAVMVPQTIVRLDRIPRSPLTGKAVPSQLPPPPAVADRPGPIAPSTTEQTVAGLVADVLGRSPGADEDFFAAGGDSLRGLQLLSRIAQAIGAALTFDQLRSAPTVAGLTALVNRAPRYEPGAGAVTPTGEHDEWRPVSRGQTALWYLDKLHRGAATYAVPLGYWISGPLDVDRMDAALTELLTRHEALRTTLTERDGRVWSRLQPPAPVRTRVTEVADRAAATRRAEADAVRPFDLSAGPLLRSSCYRVDDVNHLWLLDVHHGSFDAWSLGVFWREFAALYQGRRLPEPTVRYADYVAWQERWLASEEAAGQRRYWTDRLSGDTPAVEPGRPTGAPGQAGFSIPLKLGGLGPAQVEDVARVCGSTPFGVLLAGFFATLHRMTGGADDIVVGVPMAGRGRAGTEELIGYLVNTVPLRMRLTPRMSFRELVERTDAALAEALSRQDLPFSEIAGGVSQGGDAAENPVFQTMFVLQSTPVDDGSAIDGLEVTEQLIHSGTAKVALTCTLRLDTGGVTGEVEYATRRFDRPSADRWQDALVTLLASALADPSARLAELPLLPLAAATAQVTAINADHRDRSAAGTLLDDAFRAALARDPSAVAVQAGTNAVTYAELDARAEAIAATLAAAGIGPEALVGACVERSAASIAALLGVLRAGAGFVPLDAGYPAERLRWIAADSAMAAVIASAVPAGLEDVPVIDPAAAAPEGRPDVGVHPRNTAFVYYTSGSTGRPKGVIIDHGCAASRVEWIARRYRLAPGRRVLHKTPLIFDVAIWEIFATLGAGATVLLAEAGTETDVPYLAELLATPETVLAHFVPSMLDMYLATVSATKYPGLEHVQTSGEAVPAALLRRFAAHFDVELDNAYGQTETSEVALWSGRLWPDGGSVPMGRAVNGYRLFVLDEALQPVAPGVVGELYVAGVDGLARGYLGRPDLTAERFLPHPWPVTPGERLYRTGDLAVRDDDGLLHYAGRSDGQAKVRGVRVEPGEIEEVLRGHSAVEQAAVRIREDEPGTKEIVAYLVGPDAVVPDVAEYAAGYLSRYLLPAVYVKLAALPLTPSGKVDRQALPAPTAQDRGARAGISETTSLIESQLAEVWCGLLNVEEIGRRQNFFEAGGSSLSALQMLHRVKTRFGVVVTVRQFFSAPTIAGVAEYLEKALVAELAVLSEDDAAQRGDREG
ncbi:amino acid adenylation domain-containing protein [Streptomyces sp. H10-C2]|uniref:non-ribosomal peptide synthetase n=1 Tax=unclassified Streptomyces TaxID=2593676 RepID=UPI0024BAD7A1|nr:MULTISPECIES: non-ribosomal peptide synthetase [unclassified Streptomyces]MDJ0344777.1 amino acid adenylation domain-containing protein [Streptomyces sp. PH10-H1]MDJ0369662.1 amino acid adenylation domain-containing protein [Streptomyces sp. H10-C2]